MSGWNFDTAYADQIREAIAHQDHVSDEAYEMNCAAETALQELLEPPIPRPKHPYAELPGLPDKATFAATVPQRQAYRAASAEFDRQLDQFHRTLARWLVQTDIELAQTLCRRVPGRINKKGEIFGLRGSLCDEIDRALGHGCYHDKKSV